MMKKVVALILALMMCAAVAVAAEWPEGLSPQKPYFGSPEVDFNESFGYMMLLPLNGKSVAPGMDTLSIFMPRDDVELAEGTVKLFTKEDGLVEEIAIGSESIVLREMTDAELEDLMWGSGKVLEVKLSQPMAANCNYYVQMTEGSLIAEGYEVASPKIDGKKAWTFSTEVKSYVEKMQYCRMVEGKEEPETIETVQVGDMAKISVVIGEDVKAAALYCDEGTMISEQTYIEESGEMTVNFPANGEVKWGVVFLDAENKAVYNVDYTTVVSEMTAE